MSGLLLLEEYLSRHIYLYMSEGSVCIQYNAPMNKYKTIEVYIAEYKSLWEITLVCVVGQVKLTGLYQIKLTGVHLTPWEVNCKVTFWALKGCLTHNS